MLHRLREFALLVAVLGFTLPCSAEDNLHEQPVAHLIASAKAARVRGATNEALQYFDAAIKKDSSDYLTLFQRGATYLSAGRHTQAKSDFDSVLRLKPGFEAALLQRAKIEARNAEWEAAKKDYKDAGAKGAEELKQLEEAEGASYIAFEAEKTKDWDSCVNNAGVAIMTAAGSLALRQLRSRCRLEKGEIEMGISDLQHVLQIQPSLLEPYVHMSSMQLYSLGQVDPALANVKKCLQSDPDYKPCKALFKEEKALSRAMKRVDELLASKKYNQASKELTGSTPDTEPGLLADIKTGFAAQREQGYIHPAASQGLYTMYLEKTCEAFMGMNNHRKAAPYCKEILQLDPHSLRGLLHQAQAHLDAENYEAAINALNTAKEHHPSEANSIAQKLQEAQLALKKSKNKDYYKILGVDRNADERQIKKAYRSATKVYHPDKAHAQGISKEDAEKKMAAINEAYEVLSDPELKQRFDGGDDPNDPMARQGGNPFEGGMPFGFPMGGGQQFVFQQGGGGGGGKKFKFSTGGGGGGGGGGMPFNFPGFG
jgi:DnaJ homolog subfamily C member 3